MLAAVEQLLKSEIGLDSSTVGLSIVRHALKKRMTACQIVDPQLYWDYLKGSRTELQELINATIVPETWFFRDREAFFAMAAKARTMREAGRTLRLLSLPCSTGEEPYSMAMAMFDAGFTAQEFSIDAIDISTRNLAEAESAIYGRNSFRGTDLDFRDRYFEPFEGGFQPGPAVRSQVRFRLGNLFDTGSGAGGHDIIFCRNLLIYFDRETQDRALDRLNQALSPRGLLFVGPAESGLPGLRGFASVRVPMAFAFAKAGNVEARPATPVARRPRPPRPAAPTVAARPAVAGKPAKAIETPAAAPKADDAAQSLAAIERAANAGRIAEAKALALAHLKSFGPSPAIFYLLGLAHDAADASADAIQNYRKALYLDPDHREALAHLALILRQQGDMAGANALNGRLARIEKRSRA